jgi:hypothetical protein
MAINDETVEVAGQTADGRTPRDAVELVRAAEPLVDDGERT